MQSLQRFFNGLSVSNKLAIISLAVAVISLVVAVISIPLSFIGNVYTPVVQAKWNITEAQNKENKTDVKRITASDKIPVTKTLEQGTKSSDIAIKNTSVLEQPRSDVPKMETDKPKGISNPTTFINTGDPKSSHDTETLNTQPNSSVPYNVRQISNQDFAGVWKGIMFLERDTFPFEIFIEVRGSNIKGYSRVTDGSGNYGIRNIDADNSRIINDEIIIQEAKELTQGIHPPGGYWTSKRIKLSLKKTSGQLSLGGIAVERDNGITWNFSLSRAN